MTGRVVFATGPDKKMVVFATNSRRDSRVREQAAKHLGESDKDVAFEDIDFQSALWRVTVKNPKTGEETTSIKASKKKNGAILMAKQEAIVFLNANTPEDLKCVRAEKIFTASKIGLNNVVPIH